MKLKIILASAMLIPLTTFGDDGVAKKTSQVANPLFNTGFYSSRSPVELLKDLTILHALNPELNGRITLPILDPPGVQGWLTDERLRELIKSSRDETPCLQAVNAISSFHLVGPSTVGQEARRMIEAALDGGYPPIQSSAQSPEQIEAKLDSFLDNKNDLQK